MRTLVKWLVRALVLVVVIAIIGGVLLWRSSRPDDPGSFYAYDDDVPTEPGVVVRSEGFDRAVPPGATAHRFLYTTATGSDGAAIASATVLVPDGPVPDGGVRPVLAWAHGTTGIANGCAPSVLPEPWGGIPALEEIIAAGWIVVATDYVGLGTEGTHQYLVGDTAAYNVLDSIRALDSLDDQDPDVFGSAELGDRPVVWGHSQGGHSALFTAQFAADYAPEIDLAGVAGIAPATDLAALLAAADDSPVGKVLSSLTMVSWADVYPDVDLDTFVRPAARPLVEDMASRCLTAPGALLTLVEAAALRQSVFAVDPATTEPTASLLRENSPAGPFDLPVFVAQGEADEVVAPAVTEAFVDQTCETGDVIELHTYADGTHLSVAEEDSPVDGPLLAWTEDRFADAPAPTACTSTDH